MFYVFISCVMAGCRAHQASTHAAVHNAVPNTSCITVFFSGAPYQEGASYTNRTTYTKEPINAS